MKLSPRQRQASLTLFAGAGLLSCGLTSLQVQTNPEPTPEQATFFETKVRPVLAANCFSCHGPNSQMGGLRLDSPEGLQKASAIVSGEPEKSLLVHVVRYDGPVKMPPKGKLKPEEIAALEAWIKMGAPWPKAAIEKRKQDAFLWSLQPVAKPKIPVVKLKTWPKNPIDNFVLAKLEAKGQHPSPAADRRTLLRRVTYDLIGLPPTAEETDAFLADKSLNAYEKVVDRLLASPRYGESWARHWLDIARYADTKGYVFVEDRNYPNAYTYREWVIKSLNADLPYNRFVMDQLAADRLPETQGDDKTDLAALGFLTLGRRFLNSQPDIIDDRIDVTMRGLQGFTVACARCHDHKFDPIPTQDYYSLYAVFNSSEERALAISQRAIREPWERYNADVAAAENEIREIATSQIKLLRTKPTEGEVKSILAATREEALPEGMALQKVAGAFEPAARDRFVFLLRQVEQLKKTPPTTPEFAMAMVDSGHPGDGVVFKRGNPGNPGEAAPRRFLSALSKGERAHWTEGSGRLELAKSIASSENPLTARVFVNRVWLNHFGAGLVRTPSDFGHQGEPPTHPELLDYLSSTFMENGWSIKRLHRLIVTSATYRQTSDVSPAMLNADPDNRTLNRMNRRRLDLEQMRDSIMADAGRLDITAVGGKSVDLWSRPFTGRRAVYGFIERQNLPGIFRTFDFASPDSTSARRFQTTVPQQALFFLNSPFAIDAARSLADRPDIKSAKDNGQRLRRLYRLLFDRLPDADETATGLAYLNLHDPSPKTPVWQYGYGAFDGHRDTFDPLSHFVDGGYRFGETFPDKDLGYLTLRAEGGHPGHDASHAIIRRWVAPVSGNIRIEGVLKHPNNQGDGVHGRIVSSRYGPLGEWKVKNGEAKTNVASIDVQKGDLIDFVVEPGANDGYDAFAWSPTIRSDKGTWNAAADFAPPPDAGLTRLTLYIQALMMTNEFMFVD